MSSPYIYGMVFAYELCNSFSEFEKAKDYADDTYGPPKGPYSRYILSKMYNSNALHQLDQCANYSDIEVLALEVVQPDGTKPRQTHLYYIHQIDQEKLIPRVFVYNQCTHRHWIILF